MAKSEGNVVLAKGISLPLGKPVDEKSLKLSGKIVRSALLETHYRQPLNMRDRYLQTAVNRWISLVHTIEFALRDSSLEEVKNFCKIAIETPPDSRMLEALCDDLNTPVAMARLRALIKRVDKAYMQKKSSKPSESSEKLLQSLISSVHFLGLLPTEGQFMALREASERMNLIVKLDERKEARKEKNWQRADEIRDELAKEGIEIEDTENGTRWKSSSGASGIA